MTDMIVRYSIVHNGTMFRPGEKFSSDVDESLIADLHKRGVLMTEAEANPVMVDDVIVQLRSENAALQAELEALRSTQRGRRATPETTE